MPYSNKVVYNVDQSNDTTSYEKFIARKNIGANTITVTNPATAFSGDLNIDYNSSVGAYNVSVNDTNLGIMATIPSEPNKFLSTSNEGRVVWVDAPEVTAIPVNLSWTHKYGEADSDVQTTCSIKSLKDSYETDVHEIFGIMTFTPSMTQRYAFCPYNQAQEFIYGLGEQCEIVDAVSGIPATITFKFSANVNNPCPSYVAVKGQSLDNNVTIWNLMVQKRS